MARQVRLRLQSLLWVAPLPVQSKSFAALTWPASREPPPEDGEFQFRPLRILHPVRWHAIGHHANHPALVFEEEIGALRRRTFAELEREANAVACGLRRLGIRQGQPVGIHTGQAPETAIAHLALYKLGAIVVPLSQLYGPETLRYILRDSGLTLVLTDIGSANVFGELQTDLRTRLTLIFTGTSPQGSISFADLLNSPSQHFEHAVRLVPDLIVRGGQVWGAVFEPL
jgi:acyl-coenzyme A synthetase/AMP-(fatty) acid ligase